MSIYLTTLDMGFEHASRCERMTRVGWKLYEQDDSKPCTCGNALRDYPGSHIFPARKGPSTSSLHLAVIARHISRNGSDDRSEKKPHSWLRLSVNQATVLLTKHQVRRLRDALTEWLDSFEVQ